MKYIFIGTLVSVIAFGLLAIKPNAVAKVNIENNNANLNKPIPASKHLDSIVLGAGCFWGAEKRYAETYGVVDAISGYADGKGVTPVYREITKRRNKNNPDNHAEVVKVTYNKSATKLEAILRRFFEGHNPTQVNRQGNDVGTQYRSLILTNSTEQTRIAKQVLNQYQIKLSEKGYGKIATEIKPIKTFFPAEDVHQDYLKKNPLGYCPDHSTGVLFESEKSKTVVDNTLLTKGQQIVIIDSDHCPFCEKFKKDVISKYKKLTPITLRRATELENLTIKTATWATPTIIFLKDGVEVFGHQGYMKPEQFYEAHAKYQFR